MTIHIAIIMTMNIYINRINTEYLKSLTQTSMSGLVNALLDEHRATVTNEPTIQVPQRAKDDYMPTKPLNIPGVQRGADFVPKPPDPETGYPCCVGRKPCKHWSWDGIQGLWVNSLTNKTREE